MGGCLFIFHCSRQKSLRAISTELAKVSSESEALYAEMAPQFKRAANVARELLEDLENISVRIR